MIKREFKINLKSMIIWSISLCLIFLLVFLVYPSINIDQEMMDNMMSMFPEEMMSAFNMDIVSINSVFGWYQTEGYIFLLLLGGIYSAVLGATILSKEENDKTIEFLYSKPITRNKIVFSKIFAGITYILIFTLIVTIFNFFGFLISDDLELKKFLILSLTPLLIYYVFFFISLFISTFFTKTKKAMSLGIALVFLSYILQIVGGISTDAEFIKYMSVFEIAPARNLISNEGIEFIRILIGILIIIGCIILTLVRYNKKELV